MESGQKVIEKGPQLLEEFKGFIELEDPPMRDKSGGSPFKSPKAFDISDGRMLSLHSS